jgi:hypothetical protein
MVKSMATFGIVERGAAMPGCGITGGKANYSTIHLHKYFSKQCSRVIIIYYSIY